MLSVSNLSLRYAEKEILNNLSFELGHGEHLLILGPNGSGKSTLVKSLAGLLSPSGEIKISGNNIRSYDKRELYRNIAYMPQQIVLDQNIPVLDFLLYSRYPYKRGPGFYSEEDIDICRIALQELGFEAFSKRLLSELSFGERQMVLLAACLAQDTGLLLLDEPANYLDPKHQKLLEELMIKIGGENVSIVCVSHDPSMLSGFFHKVLALQGGKQIYFGDSPQFIKSGKLSETYGVEFTLLRDNTGGKEYICRK